MKPDSDIHTSSPPTHTHAPSTDGTVLGVILDSASEEEIAQFDSLLSELGTLKVKETSEERGGQEVGMSEGAESQWGSTVAEVKMIILY